MTIQQYAEIAVHKVQPDLRGQVAQGAQTTLQLVKAWHETAPAAPLHAACCAFPKHQPFRLKALLFSQTHPMEMKGKHGKTANCRYGCT